MLLFNAPVYTQHGLKIIMLARSLGKSSSVVGIGVGFGTYWLLVIGIGIGIGICQAQSLPSFSGAWLDQTDMTYTTKSKVRKNQYAISPFRLWHRPNE